MKAISIKIRSVSILLHCIKYRILISLFKKGKFKARRKKVCVRGGGGGSALHFVNIHHGQINITQCMHTYGRYNVHCPIILVLTGTFKHRT